MEHVAVEAINIHLCTVRASMCSQLSFSHKQKFCFHALRLLWNNKLHISVKRCVGRILKRQSLRVRMGRFSGSSVEEIRLLCLFDLWRLICTLTQNTDLMLSISIKNRNNSKNKWLAVLYLGDLCILADHCIGLSASVHVSLVYMHRDANEQGDMQKKPLLSLFIVILSAGIHCGLRGTIPKRRHQLGKS